MDSTEAVDIYVMLWRRWWAYWVEASFPKLVDGKYVYGPPPLSFKAYTTYGGKVEVGDYYPTAYEKHD